MSKKTVFILGAGSDIGLALTECYSLEGRAVAGTYRQKNSLKDGLVPDQVWIESHAERV